MPGCLREKVLRTVEYNTGGKQPDTIDLVHIRVIACGSNDADPDAVKRAVADLLEDGELVKAGRGYKVAE